MGKQEDLFWAIGFEASIHDQSAAFLGPVVPQYTFATDFKPSFIISSILSDFLFCCNKRLNS